MRALILAATTLVLGGCSAAAPEDRSVQVVTGLYPVQFVAERIAGEHAEVTSLVSAGGEAHDLELTVEQTALVSEADLVIHAAGLQPAVDDAVASLAEGTVVEALGVLEANDPAIGGARPVRVIEGDPHFWLDPRALATVAREVDEQLAAIDPDHADEYRDNGAALHGQLVELDGQLSTGLDRCERRTVVVSHDAFAYLGYRYDLDVAPVAGLSPHAEPSPARLARLRAAAEERGVTTIFTAPLESPELADTLAADLGVTTATLDPVEGLSTETADEDYLSLMRTNLAALRAANGCR